MTSISSKNINYHGLISKEKIDMPQKYYLIIVEIL